MMYSLQDEYLPSVTLTWYKKRLQVLHPTSIAFTLEEQTSNSTTKHAYFYSQLRNFLLVEVFSFGYQLPRCHPPAGGSNWTPAIANYTSSVSTLSLVGENPIVE